MTRPVRMFKTCEVRAKGGLGHLAPKIAVESLSSISSIQHIS